jgi:hypothetical protein
MPKKYNKALPAGSMPPVDLFNFVHMKTIRG